jgi:diaminohydroxyphosphoribosylaminopyrimidine deaminase/5-amino-6-(5-phosphoribosylamino)uracil reductase
MSQDDDEAWLLKAIDLSGKCPPTEKAFSVGAIIVGANNELISSGFSRERSPSEHAEELAIIKAKELDKHLNGATIYSSLEPCNPRLSGKTSCTDLIIASGITKVVFALHEPPTFVTCTGTQHLKAAGITVIVLNHLAELFKAKNKKFFQSSKAILQ